MKYTTALVLGLLLATPAAANPDQCGPSQGNWVDAATTTCVFNSSGHADINSYVPRRPEPPQCEPKGDDDTTVG